MGCGCKKNQNRNQNSKGKTVDNRCEVLLKDLETLILKVIRKTDFNDKKEVLDELQRMKDTYYKTCPDSNDFELLKKYIENV